MSNHWKVQTYCFPNTICFCLDCKNTENKQNKIKDRVHNAENLEIATEISEARNKNQTVESNKEVNWNKSTNEAFCISAQISSVFPPVTLFQPMLKWAWIQSSSQQVCQKIQGGDLFWCHCHQKSYSYKHTALFTFVSEVNSVVTIQEKTLWN